jgi:spermidine/putrescine transport system ATP-binding protein
MSDAGLGLTAQAASNRPPDGMNAVAEADVRLQEVTKRFDNVTAVDRVTLEVYRGEVLSMSGPSGCGKTTTMRLIAGLEQPDAGQILVRGQHMDGVPPYERMSTSSSSRSPYSRIFCYRERRVRAAHARPGTCPA